MGLGLGLALGSGIGVGVGVGVRVGVRGARGLASFGRGADGDDPVACHLLFGLDDLQQPHMHVHDAHMPQLAAATYARTRCTCLSWRTDRPPACARGEGGGAEGGCA